MPNLTRKEIMRLFYRASMTALGFDPDKKYGTTKPPVRLTYSTYGKPDWSVGDDVLFITFAAMADETTQPIHETWKDAGRDLIRTHGVNRVIQVSFTAYGPNCYENLIKLRHAFMDGSDILRAADIMLIPDESAPQYAPEMYQNMWWDRADMSMRFNNTMTWEEDVKAIEEVPVSITENPEGSSRTYTESGIYIKKG